MFLLNSSQSHLTSSLRFRHFSFPLGAFSLTLAFLFFQRSHLTSSGALYVLRTSTFKHHLILIPNTAVAHTHGLIVVANNHRARHHLVGTRAASADRIAARLHNITN
ncbi:hypothetical protein P3T76_010801 [Phytophthora citrophthora]|uniref:Uncharacterized protein n=1 Tax=Phytophthora citrophthora TaxID=4793 RepID=A0AAD9GB16_9STRA|nr:hypothetical protein P3T76_010801 [Phytophthora citrophthora]